MVYINLLPWRETEFKRKRRNFFIQTVTLLSLTFIVSGFLWAKNVNQIKLQLENIETIKTQNHAVFSQLKNFQSAKALNLRQKRQTQKINQLIAMRQTIPDLLALLQKSKLYFQVSHLLVNHKSIKVKGTDISTESALSLLNTLREESEICQVTFTPLQTEQVSQLVEFELKAHICNENTG